MTDQHIHPEFPHDDALCERCGYSLKGLSYDSACPECGYDVSLSSPEKRIDRIDESLHSFGSYFKTVFVVLTRPSESFRRLAVDPGEDSPGAFLTRSCFFASMIWLIVFSIVARVSDVGGNFGAWFTLTLIQFIVLMFVLHALAYIEMLGVTAFSRRRGWRVPFHLSKRVCCYASVAWLPGMLIAVCGVLLLKISGIGERSFFQYVGLVRVGWLLYGTLFVLSLLWFETLVWIGVRQVWYANAWPDPPQNPPADTPQT